MGSAKPDAGRPDYNAAAHFTQLQPGEPYFLIRGRDHAADPRIMLAEERALTAAMSRLRPVLAVLFEGGAFDEETGVFTYTPPRDELAKLKDRACPIRALRNLKTALRGTQQPQG